MKKMNVVAFVTLIISFLLLSQVLAELSSSSNNETSSVSQTNDENQTAAFKRTYHHRPRINCGHACARRCSKTSRKKVCHRACGSCCAKKNTSSKLRLARDFEDHRFLFLLDISGKLWEERISRFCSFMASV